MACQHFPDVQTLQLQAGAGEDNVIRLLSGLDRVACEGREDQIWYQLVLIRQRVHSLNGWQPDVCAEV